MYDGTRQRPYARGDFVRMKENVAVHLQTQSPRHPQLKFGICSGCRNRKPNQPDEHEAQSRNHGNAPRYKCRTVNSNSEQRNHSTTLPSGRSLAAATPLDVDVSASRCFREARRGCDSALESLFCCWQSVC